MCAKQDRGAGDVNGAGEEVRVLMKSDPSQRESLQMEAEVDPMDGEQTWPTESELQEAEGITNAGIHSHTHTKEKKRAVINLEVCIPVHFC